MLRAGVMTESKDSWIAVVGSSAGRQDSRAEWTRSDESFSPFAVRRAPSG